MSTDYTLENFTIQVIVSDGDEASAAGDNIDITHVMVACLHPYGLGVPEGNVRLYCSPDKAFDTKSHDKEKIRDFLNGQLRLPTETYQSLLPDFYESGDGFFDYFWSILSRFKPLMRGRLGNCAMRIICGHSVGYDTGPTALTCGNVQVNFHDLVQENASILTTLDCCLPMNAVLGLRGIDSRNAYKKKKLKWDKASKDINFPVACPGTTLTYGFFVSFPGHHSLNKKDEGYLRARNAFNGMSKTIGFPIISSIMVAVKARYIEQSDTRNLGEISEEQFRSVQPRYIHAKKKHTPKKVTDECEPHFDLKALQKLLDEGILVPRPEAFNCVLYSRNEEWFN